MRAKNIYFMEGDIILFFSSSFRRGFLQMVSDIYTFLASTFKLCLDTEDIQIQNDALFI